MSWGSPAFHAWCAWSGGQTQTQPPAAAMAVLAPTWAKRAPLGSSPQPAWLLCPAQHHWWGVCSLRTSCFPWGVTPVSPEKQQWVLVLDQSVLEQLLPLPPAIPRQGQQICLNTPCVEMHGHKGVPCPNTQCLPWKGWSGRAAWPQPSQPAQNAATNPSAGSRGSLPTQLTVPTAFPQERRSTAAHRLDPGSCLHVRQQKTSHFQSASHCQAPALPPGLQHSMLLAGTKGKPPPAEGRQQQEASLPTGTRKVRWCSIKSYHYEEKGHLAEWLTTIISL